jgi:CRP/FNR family transcriptional regulator
MYYPHMLPYGRPPFLPTDPVLSNANSSKARRYLEPHAMIFFDGQINMHLYKVIDGCVALYQLLDDGRRQIIDIIGPGRIFGYPMSTYAGCAAEALTYTRISVCGAPNHSEDLNSELLLSLARSRDHVMLLGRKTAMERVATAMVDLSKQFARNTRSTRTDRVTFTLYLTRYELADWLGLTFETVSRCLSQLKRDKTISYDQPESVTVLEMNRLRQQAGITTKTQVQ